MSAVDPDLVAGTTFHALGDLISKCSPENQPSPHVLEAFLKLYAEIRATPPALEVSVRRLETAIGALTGRAISGIGGRGL